MINSGGDIKAVIQGECGQCSLPILIPNMDTAKDERPLGNGRVPDVTGFFNGEPVFLVEVLHTHASEDHELPWIEVLAADIIEDPSLWVSTRKMKCGDIIRIGEMEEREDRGKYWRERRKRGVQDREMRSKEDRERWAKEDKASEDKARALENGEVDEREEEECRWRALFPSPGNGGLNHAE
jgi:hypothetical protein